MHLFEFMDLHWYPRLLRDLQTNILQVIMTRSPAFDAAGHHIDKLLLSDAQSTGQAICAVDYVPSKVLVLVLSPLTFVVSILQFYLLSFLVRPVSWKQLLFTNLIPIVPVVAAWDGFVSAMRKYDAAALKEIVEARTTSSYSWEVGVDRGYSKSNPMTYLIGKPITS